MTTAQDAPSPQFVRVGPDQLPVLRRIFEYYLYDFSEILGGTVGENGAFVHSEKWDSELARPNMERWLVRVGGVWAGFAILAHDSWLDGRRNVHDVDEFFIMRGQRRRGIGRQVARQMFALHAGPWEIRVLDSNPAAVQFWRTVVDEFTRGQFRETPLNTPRWKGPVFSFDSAGPG